jgi:hypothetical protein
MPRELCIPPDAMAHPSVEMIRVWLANKKQHVVLNMGFWEERGIDERTAWGILLADMIQHIANAHQSEYGRDRAESIRMIVESFQSELQAATSERMGSFVKDRNDGD